MHNSGLEAKSHLRVVDLRVQASERVLDGGCDGGMEMRSDEALDTNASILSKEPTVI